MPVCQNCGKKWTWGQTIKALFRLKCPYCKEKQYETSKSKMRNSMVGFIVMLLVIFPINLFLDLSTGTVFGFAILVAVVLLGIYPFVLKLSNEEEPYW